MYLAGANREHLFTTDFLNEASLLELSITGFITGFLQANRHNIQFQITLLTLEA